MRTSDKTEPLKIHSSNVRIGVSPWGRVGHPQQLLSVDYPFNHENLATPIDSTPFPTHFSQSISLICPTIRVYQGLSARVSARFAAVDIIRRQPAHPDHPHMTPAGPIPSHLLTTYAFSGRFASHCPIPAFAPSAQLPPESWTFPLPRWPHAQSNINDHRNRPIPRTRPPQSAPPRSQQTAPANVSAPICTQPHTPANIRAAHRTSDDRNAAIAAIRA